MQQDGSWLSIIDYAKLKNSSISTVRRHIKSNKLRSRLEDGKYHIFVKRSDQESSSQREELKHKLEIELLKVRIRELEEENNDLKMLVDLYERRLDMPVQEELPQIPIL